MRREWANIHPIMGVEDGLITNGKGDLTLVLSVKLPDVFTMGKDDFQEMNVQLTSAINTLPVHSCIHQVCMVWPELYESDHSDAQSMTERADLRYWDQKPQLRMKAYLCVTVSTRPAEIKKTNMWAGAYTAKEHMRQPNISRALRESSQRKEVFDSFLVQLKSVRGIEFHRCDTPQTLNLLYQYHSFDFSKSSTAGLEGYKIPPVWVEPEGMQLGDLHVRALSMTGLGNRVSLSSNHANAGLTRSYGTSDRVSLPVSFSYPLTLGLPVPHILSVSLEMLDRDVVSSYLTGKNNWLKMLRTVSTSAGIHYDSNEKFRQQLYMERLQAVNMGVNLLIASPYKKTLENALRLGKSAFTQMGAAVTWVENISTLPCYLHSIPGNRKGWGRNLLMTTQTGVRFLAMESPYRSDLEGFHYLDRFGKPVKVNLWYNHRVTNVNMIIVGTSGSGKSYFANGFIQKALNLGDHVTIIDVGHSYRRICELNKGHYVDSENMKSMGLDIFQGPGGVTATQDAKDLMARKNLILAVVKTIWKGESPLGNDERAVLKEVINTFYDDGRPSKDIRGFFQHIRSYRESLREGNDFRLKMVNFDSLLINLQPFVDGEFEWVLSGTGAESVLDDKQFTVFSLQFIRQDSVLYPIYALILVEQILSKIRRMPLETRKRFFIDEAWSVFRGSLAPFVEYLYRTVRKFNGQVCTITQHAGDIRDTGIEDAIKINTDIKIILRQGDVNEEMEQILRNTLGLTTRDLKLLASLTESDRGREVLIKMGRLSRVYINEVSPESDLVFTTHPDQVARFNKVLKKTGGLASAVGEYLEIESQQLP